MIHNKKKTMDIRALTLLALLTAFVAILSYLGGFIKIGGLASISLTLIPVVLGGALLGPVAGAYLGGVSGVVFFFTADAAFWLGLHVAGTVIIVMLKGIAAGLCSGLVYRLLANKNSYLAVLASAVVCPLVNTGIFLLGCVTFFADAVNGMAASEGMSVGLYLILVFVGWNFVFELLSNVLFSPSIFRLLNIRKKTMGTKM